jgi:hypothetical protein
MRGVQTARTGMHGTNYEWRGLSQAHTFVASLLKDEYFWMASWIVSASVTLNKVRRTIGMLVGRGGLVD